MPDTTATSKIFGIGANGLIGSRISELFADSNPITNLSTKTGVNITDFSTLAPLIDDKDHDFVILFAAKADVDGCEKDKALGEDGEAFKINVLGAENVAKACKQSGKKLIYISTDFVFSGDDTPTDGYIEDDTCSPVDWYGMTKFKGEEAVKASGAEHIILRIAYPYRSYFEIKKDFVHAIAARLKDGLSIKAVTDHIMTPTYVDDIATAIRVLLQENLQGIYHAVGSEFVTPYDAALAIASEFGFDQNLISPTTRAEFFKDRAPRPFNLSLKNDKIERLEVGMRTFRQGLGDLKQAENI